MSAGSNLAPGQSALLEIMERTYNRPDLFVVDVLGAKPSAQQIEGLKVIAQPGAKVSIRSGHNTGKTTFLAWVILWWLVTRYDCKIPCTAPSAGQLSDALWPELYKWRDRMPSVLAQEIEINSERIFIKSAPQLQFGMARTARKDKPDALQGKHAPHMLYILDEAPGIDDEVYEAARSSLSSPGARIIMAGNPTKLSGFFWKSHHEERHRWTCLHWSCLNSPLPSKSFIQEALEDYGADSNYYRVRVLGEFPTSEDDQFIPIDIVEPAVMREGVTPEGPMVWGLDPAGMGGAEMSLARRQGPVVHEVEGVRGLEPMAASGWVIDRYEEAKVKPVVINIDIIGVGLGVYSRLKELGYPVCGVNVSETPSSGRFLNLRADLWHRYKTWFQSRSCSIPKDQKLIGQSCAPHFDFNSSGKLQIESKQHMRARGVVSPDRADAVCLTFFQVPAASEVRASVQDEYLKQLDEIYAPAY